jgi:signal transduction histidine kinase/tetratricopeptide (TPR) repeat protein
MKIVLLLLLFAPFFTVAQNSNYRIIDSLQALTKNSKADTTLADLYNQISYNYIYQNADSGIAFANKGLALSQKINWQKGVGNAYLQMGSHLISKGNYDTSLLILNLAIKSFTTINDNYSVGKVYNQLGILKGNKGNYPEALDYFFESLAIFENSDNSSKKASLAGAYENIGTIYNFTENYDKAVFYLEKCIDVLQQLKNRQSNIALNFTNIGTVYQKQNNTTKAMEAFEKANTILVNQKDNFAIAFLNSSWATTYLYNKNYELSIEKNQLALTAANISGDKELITSITQNLGYAQFKSGSIKKDEKLYEEGFDNLSQSLLLYKNLGNQDGLRKAYLYLSDYYFFKDDFRNAFLMHQGYTNYNDSIYNLKNKQSLQNLEDQRTIELNKKEIELNQLSLANKEKQKWFYLAAVLLLSCIGVLFFYQSRSRKKTNIQLQQLNNNLDEANKTKTRFFSILNHDLRSPVANLIQFLHLQKDSPEIFDEESKNRLQQKTILGAENLLSSMEDILLWSKGQMTNFKPVIKNIAIGNLFADTQKHFDSFENVTITFEPTYLQINTDENYLKTIMRNFTSNAIKALEYTPNATICWKAYQQNDKIFLSITDNGPGASSELLKALYDDKEVVGIKSGLGLHLIRDLAKAINATITTHANKYNGTTFILAF